MTRGRAIGAAGLVIVIGLVCAAAAGAAGRVVESDGGLKYASKAFRMPPGTTKTFAVRCPTGHHVFGGGQQHQDGYGDILEVHSYPFDGRDRDSKPDDGWKVQLTGYDRYVDGDVFAICAKRMPRYPTKRVQVAPRSNSGAVAVSCGAREALSGGSRGARDARATAAYPVPTMADGSNWGFRFDNVANVTRKITAYAVCARLPVMYGSASQPIGAVSHEDTTAVCPAPAPHVVGGGQRNDHGYEWIRFVESGPNQRFGSPDAWEVSVDNGAGDLASMTAYAVCVASP